MERVKSNNRIRRYWNRFSEGYDFVLQQPLELIYRQMLPFLSLETATTIAEVGSGTGFCLEILRKNTLNSVIIFANDLSEEMVAKIQKINLENVKAIVANNEDLPYENECCNKYISSLSLHIVREPKKMLKEAFRILQPNGVAVFSVWGKAEKSNIFAVMIKALAKSGFRSKMRSPFYLNSSEQLNQMISEAGFVDVKSFYSSAGMNIMSSDEYVEKIIRIPKVLCSSEEDNEVIISNLKKEADKVLRSGKILTFDVLIAYGRKPSSIINNSCNTI